MAENSTWNRERFSYSELRIIGISLSILSLGIALAWLGFFWMTSEKNDLHPENKAASEAGSLKP